ncbi:hypothetical protein V6N12_030396 [Hibiscus sabdariffa]|uniref:Uncharacterized protein n=1 Tax=Hibiscus sabdariffa TaxID=183260 RepID=A0ABR2C0U8_9ROSI
MAEISRSGSVRFLLFFASVCPQFIPDGITSTQISVQLQTENIIMKSKYNTMADHILKSKACIRRNMHENTVRLSVQRISEYIRGYGLGSRKNTG